MRRACLLLLAGACALATCYQARSASAQQRALPSIELKAGLVITQSARVLPRVYELPSVAPTDAPIIIIRGDKVTGAQLEVVVEPVTQLEQDRLEVGDELRVCDLGNPCSFTPVCLLHPPHRPIDSIPMSRDFL